MDTDTEDFLDEMTQVEVVDEMTGEQMPQVEVIDEMTGEQTPINVQSGSVYSFDTFIASSNIYDEGPSTSARASRKCIQPKIQKYKEVQVDVDVMPDMKALREVVKSLTLHKIVQLHFDEVYTSHDTRYSRSADRLYECAYVNGKTQPCKTIICFGVRSILTPFNMLLAAIADISTRYQDSAKFFHTILDAIEEIGLNLKAVILGKKRRHSVKCWTAITATDCTFLQQYDAGGLKGSIKYEASAWTKSEEDIQLH
uniref:Uncharacterized protein n=1 Tax=Glossina pallidipes TaxID=7398 RepID=A0A1A9ZYM5_GLOPL